MIKSNSNFDELYAHTANVANPHGVTATQVGAIPTSQKGVANGVATLDSGGLLTAAQKPYYSYSELTGKPAAISYSTNSTILTLNAANAVLAGDLIPSADLTFNIGSATKRWESVYVGANTVYIGNTTALSGTSISIDGGASPTSASQTPTIVASRFTARPFTYNPGTGNVTVRPQIEFQDTLGLSYPISFNTDTFEFSLDAAGNYGTGSLVGKRATLSNTGGTALSVTGNMAHTGNYLNTDPTGTFRFDGSMTFGYDSSDTLTFKGSSTFQGPITLGNSVTLGDGNDTITVNAGASNAFIVTASNLSVTSTGNVAVSNNLVVGGNLTVNGTVTHINSTQVDIGDNIIVLNSGITGSTDPTQDAGFQVARGTGAAVYWVWDETNDYWTGKGQPIGNVSTISATTGSFTTANATTFNGTTFNGTTFVGALSGNASTATKIATARNITLQGDVSATTTFDGSGDAILNAALSTTGVSSGTYTKVTVDTKGRVTAGTTLSSSDVTTALGYTPADSANLASSSVSTATPNTIVLRDSTASFAANVVTAASFVGPVTGNASTATVLQTARNIILSGDVTGTSNLFNGSANATITATLANSGVTAGSYGSTTSVGTFTVDATGRLTSASSASIAFPVSSVAGKTGVVTIASADITDATSSSTPSVLVKRDTNGSFSANVVTAALFGNASTATTLQTARNFIFTGDATNSGVSFNGSADASIALTLATVNGSAGSFGSATKVATFTVNAKGLVTASGETNISFPVTTVFGRTGDVTLTSSDVTTALGFTPFSAAGGTVSGDLTVTGNVTVSGTTVTVSASTLSVTDPIITLGKDSVSTSDGKDRGIEFKYGDGSAVRTGFFGWDASASRFLFISNGTNSSEVFSGTTGTVEANLLGNVTGNADTATKWATARTLSATGDATGTSGSFDGSGNASIALTLATVNSNTGSFGSATAVPVITVNGKGLITAVSTSTIAIPSSAITDATSANTANTVVLRGASGNFSAGTISATGVTLTGNLRVSVTTGISAAGNTQGGATALTSDVNVVSTSTAGTQIGVALPTAAAGMCITVINTSANAISVYPASGGTIDGLASNAAFSLGAGARLQFVAVSATQWYSLLAVYG